MANIVEENATGADAAQGANGTVIVAFARTATERELIARWALETHPGVPVIKRDELHLHGRLPEDGDPLVVPVSVTWVPPERDGDRHVKASDLLALTNPRRPPERMQSRIAANEPDRVHVVPGEPARISEMRNRFVDEVGQDDSSEAFHSFVARQAWLACERADRALIGDRYKVPRLVAEQITASARFREQVAQIAEQEAKEFDECLAYATACLTELATVQSRLAIDAFTATLGPLHRRAYDVRTDIDGLERLRELNRKHALVFLPTHRSYVDPLVLADVLARNDFPRNHLLGGNNLAFWPIGPLGKRAGVVFIRRSFGEDLIYKLAVREFLGHLVAKRFNIEWYLEGGRTRTGKLRPPKYGLLHYLVSAIDEDRAEDVMLVPVSINYSRLKEVSLMAEEQQGRKKKAEGIRWLAGYMRAQSSRLGTVDVDFGDPFSLRQALADAGEGRARLEKVAFRICDGINQATPVTPLSLVTLALLGAPSRALTFQQVERVVAPLLDYVDRRGLRGRLGELRSPGRLRLALDGLVTAGVASRFDGGPDPVWSIAPGNHTVAAFYRNAAIHHFVVRAICELALLSVDSVPTHPSGTVSADPVEAAWHEALRVRDLLKFEFFFSDKESFRLQLREELELIDPNWAQRAHTPEEARAMLKCSGILVAHRALRPFLDAQLVVAQCLLDRDRRRELVTDEFMAECLGRSRQWLLQGRLHSAESISQELFAAALQLAANRDLVDPGRDELRERRAAFVQDIDGVLANVREIGEIDTEMLSEVLDGDS
ncbi:MAG: glycerol-3-phosphate 1-O-acyltransferase [Solirubrobacteraceae bacterium]